MYAEPVKWVRKEIDFFATPEVIHLAPARPSTRSGRSMRRILRKIAEADVLNLDDFSPLAAPGVGETPLAGR